MSYESAVQKAFYELLTANSDLMKIASGVYDFVDQDKAYPYIAIGEAASNEWDTFDELGRTVIAEVHTWSNSKDSRGTKETQLMQGEIYKTLHRADLTSEGYHFVLCDSDNSNFFRDDGGLLWHGVQSFRVTLEEI